MARRAIVASGHPAVSEAAAVLLRAGGNAFDAALAAGFAAAVAEPAFTSMGGGGFLTALPVGGPAVVFDFFSDAPGRGRGAGEPPAAFVPVTVHFTSSDQVFHIGLGSVATPGNVRGFLHVHERLGRASLADVVAPAIALARDGVPLTEVQAYALGLLGPINRSTPAGRALFEPGGRPLGVGERLGNVELAAFLEQLVAEGDRSFYEGEIAQRIVREMQAGGGVLNARDLAEYAVVEREPLRTEYRDHVLLTNPAPSGGGALVAAALEAHGSWNLGADEWGGRSHAGRLVTVMEAIEHRPAAGGTTHVSVLDAAGNAASLSLSNGEGSGHVVPGTGIVLNNMLGEDDLHPEGFHATPAGVRVSSMMAPTVVLRHGDLRLVLGSSGSKRIRTALVQVVSHVVDFGLDVTAAVRAPRLHWDGAVVQAEPGLPEATLDALRERWTVNVWSAPDLYFGGVHAVDPSTGGCGDPRRGGSVVEV